MRRYIAGALLLVLVGQSSGVALANGTSKPGQNPLAALAMHLESAITTSMLFAVLTGAGDRYAAMHAPAPVMQRPTERSDAIRSILRGHPLKPRIRHGVRREQHLPPATAIKPHHRRLDPLAMRRSTVNTRGQATVSPSLSSTFFLEPLHSLAASASPRGSRRAGPRNRRQINPNVASSQGTGIEHWWTYEERAIPGIGKAMVNVGTGNYMVSAMDVDIPEKGIDLAFQRVYNSQSLHDANGDDGGDPAIFGNLWTNNFDANIVYNSTENTITVYDLDGSACTYTSNGSGLWMPCTGEFATLEPTDGTDCTYAWIKPNGTMYYFNTDAQNTGCSIASGKHGHIAEIFGRNQNNNITFVYAYYGSGHGSEDIAQIVATHSDGATLTLDFGIIPGTSINELAEIYRPDGAELQYLYDTSGNLLEVDKPGNNSASNVPSGQGVPQGDVPETYAYASGTSTLEEACGPRCTVAAWNNPNNPNDGAAIVFTPDSQLRLKNWQVQGVLNVVPQDGTSMAMEPSLPTGFQTWYQADFVYGQGPACSASGAGTTTMCDTDGHGTIWSTDASDRVTQTQEWTGTAEGAWLVTSQTWGNANNMTSSTNAGGYETDYNYDGQGNLVEMQLPSVSSPLGQVQPLSYYSYDGNNNLTAYCDPVYNQAKGYGWVGSPGDSLCPSVGGVARFEYSGDGNLPNDPNEPFGCLTYITKPSGYDTTINYPASPGPCGYGLPTSAVGDSINNQPDGSNRTPTQDFGYGQYGNLTSYDRGTSQAGDTLDSWKLAYDTENQLQQTTQNDQKIGLSGTSFTCYYPDGSIDYTETPSQHDLDKDPSCPTTTALLAGSAPAPPTHATQYYYDYDGDQVKVIRHKGCSANTPCNLETQNTCNSSENSNPTGTTCKYYDGLDRLVETVEPYDARSFSDGQAYEFYGFRWMDRYVYDLSQSGGSANLKISDVTGTITGIVAYGNLYKTREFLPQKPTNLIGSFNDPNYPNQIPGPNGPYGSGTWSDVRGSSFDGLDRPIGKYELAYGTTAVTTNTYDGASCVGLLSSAVNAVGQKTTYTCDPIQRVKQVAFSGTAPVADGRTYVFDADGRTATAANSLGTLTYTYDADGNETSLTEPTGESGASLVCYDYYGDGLRKYLSIGEPNDTCGAIPQQTLSNGIRQEHLFSYSYSHDGLLQNQQVNWNGNQEGFTWTYYPSDRENTETDPLNGETADNPPDGVKNTPLVPKAYGYDEYGRVASLKFPEGYAQSNYAYDYDDELIGYSVATVAGSVQRTLTLNARGEVLGDWINKSGLGYAQAETYSANGAQVGDGNSDVGGDYVEAPPTTLQYDVRTNMATCITNPQWAQQIAQQQVGTVSYTYDTAGRQTEFGYQSGACSGSATGFSTTYDAENHIEKTFNPSTLNLPPNPPSSLYTFARVTWGPDGRHRVDDFSCTAGCGSDIVESAHWDGDTMLFMSSTLSGPILYIGKDGVMDSSGDISISDRDQTGTQLASHASTPSSPPLTGNPWFTGLTTGSTRTIYGYQQDLQQAFWVIPGTCGFTVGKIYYVCPETFADAFGMTRADGYTMAGGIVQGARTFDPTNGQWVTPDAYAGDVHDPMSQKPFMWNGNNPVAYSDPSGYCTDPAPGQPANGCLGGVDWNLNMQFGNILQQVLTTAVSLIVLPAPAATSLAEIEQALVGTSAKPVIGGFSAYIDTAYAIGGRVWSMSEKTWNSLNDSQRWALNQQFLDQEIKQGAEFTLAPGEWGEQTIKEIQYLLDHGYEFVEEPNGSTSLAPQSNTQSLFYNAQTRPY